MEWEKAWDTHDLSEQDYLKWSKLYLRYRHPHSSFIYSFNSGQSESATIEWLFKYGKDLQLLTATYDQFRGFLYDWMFYVEPYVYRKQRWRRTEYWYTDHGTDFREKLSYTRRPEHSKKELSPKEQNRREWREHKGVERDKARNGNRWGYDRVDKEQHNRYVRRYNKSHCKAGLHEETEWDKIPNKTKGYWRCWW